MKTAKNKVIFSLRGWITSSNQQRLFIEWLPARFSDTAPERTKDEEEGIASDRDAVRAKATHFNPNHQTCAFKNKSFFSVQGEVRDLATEVTTASGPLTPLCKRMSSGVRPQGLPSAQGVESVQEFHI